MEDKINDDEYIIVIRDGQFLFPLNLNWPDHITPHEIDQSSCYIDLYYVNEDFPEDTELYNYVQSYIGTDSKCLDILKKQLSDKLWKELKTILQSM